MTDYETSLAASRGRPLNFFCLLYTSAGFVRLILALESEFAVALHEDEVDSINTMGDVFAILRAKSTDGG